jgi:transcriptional regulator
MYVPNHFKVDDQREIEAFLERYDFATLVSTTGDGLLATHLPVVVRREASGLVVAGHVARANPHWKSLDGQTQALLIFQGPHGYVSPTWYAGGPAVPTWNYGVVHAYGPARAVEDVAFLTETLEALVQRYEAHRVNGWHMDNLPSGYRDRALTAVVGIRMPVSRLEAKFKLGQNRELADRLGTIEGLDREGSVESANLAAFMRRQMKQG